MQGRVDELDTSAIESLKKINAERDVVLERLSKMDSLKERVSEQVYNRVREDYETRMQNFEEEAEPLRIQVRGQYRILRDYMVQVNQELDALKLEQEELEFRNELGEFEPEDYTARSKDSELRITEKQADLDECIETKNMFLSVFDSEEDLESGIEDDNHPHPEEPEEVSLEEEDDEVELEEAVDVEEMDDDVLEELDDEDEEDGDDEEEEDDDSEMVSDAASERDPATAFDEDDGMLPPPPSVEDSFDASALDPDAEDDALPDELNQLEADLDGVDDTSDALGGDDLPPMPRIEEEETIAGRPIADLTGDDDDLPPPPAPPSAPSSGGEEDGEGTMLISNPKVVSLNNEMEGQVFVLGMGTTSIGRSPDNDIHLTEDRVSRKHSQIAFGPGGYAIYDLNSENGTFVNGTRIREHYLSDGDIIMVGTYKFLYRDH